MALPSARRISLAVRTITALRTWPFFTRPRGIASFTLTTIVSPTPAYLRLEPPSTLMHMTRRAPELSATSKFVCIWIMVLSFPGSRGFANHFPFLQFRDRPAFLDLHPIADLDRIRLVMRVIALGQTNGLFQNGMGETTLDQNHDGLVVFVADHSPL